MNSFWLLAIHSLSAIYRTYLFFMCTAHPAYEALYTTIKLQIQF